VSERWSFSPSKQRKEDKEVSMEDVHHLVKDLSICLQPVSDTSKVHQENLFEEKSSNAHWQLFRINY